MPDRVERGVSRERLCSRVRARSVVLPFAALFCGIAWPLAARAQQDAFQQDPVDQYGSRLLAVVIVVGIGLVLFSLFRYRGRDVGPISWGFLIAGTCVFPMILSGFGTILVVERVKTVQLCGSCHLTMKSYVDDMMNPNSNSLAAVHYTNRYIAENQCYECHTSYGMFGTLEAKKTGFRRRLQILHAHLSAPLKVAASVSGRGLPQMPRPIIQISFRSRGFPAGDLRGQADVHAVSCGNEPRA